MDGSRVAHRAKGAVDLLFRIALSAIFAYAGVIKLSAPEAFLADIRSYQAFPQDLAWALVYFVPTLELVCAVGLWVPRYRQAAAIMLSLLLAAFTVLLLVSWARGLDISCGCLGASSKNKTPYTHLIARDLALLAMAAKLALKRLSGTQDSPTS